MGLDIRHEQGKRYYIPLNGEPAEAAYAEAADGTRSFNHTFVPHEMRGRGVAEALVRHALDDSLATGHRFVAVCPYVKAFVDKHPEYLEKKPQQPAA